MVFLRVYACGMCGGVRGYECAGVKCVGVLGCVLVFACMYRACAGQCSFDMFRNFSYYFDVVEFVCKIVAIRFFIL